jgi:putative ABC transport system substrate-binding protein
MRRRGFLGVLGGAAAWPVVAQAQVGRARRIGVLMNIAENDPESKVRIAAFQKGLRQLGWIDGRNVLIEYRWAAGDAGAYRKLSAELVTLGCDVIVAAGSAAVGELQKVSRTVPIVFVLVTDPVGGGFVESLARPGGNATGFTLFEFGISVKWLELLKEIVPSVTRVAALRDPTNPSAVGQWAAMQGVAPSFGVELRPIDMRDAGEIERGITTMAHTTGAGLIVTANALANVHRELIIGLAARHRLPVVYWDRAFVTSGGLASYGADVVDHYRNAPAYVDRILKGEKPNELPVQAPTKYELVINLKTAKAIGVEVSTPLLARADEVIE